MKIDNIPNFCVVSNFGLFIYDSIEDKIISFFRVVNTKEECLVPQDFFGVTWSKEYIFLSKNDSIICIDKNNEIRIFLNKEWKDIHQLYYLRDRLFVCNIDFNTIEVLGVENGNLYKIYTQKIENVNHMNSIYFKDNYFYLCVHNRKDPSYILKCNSKFEIIDKYENIGFENHNIIIEKNFLYTLNSKEGKLVKINLLNKQKESFNISIDEKSYAKGMAKNKDYFLIGLNQQEPDKDKRKYKSCVVIFDNDVNFVKSIEMPELHQTKVVKFLNGGMCHNGIDFPIEMWKKGIIKQAYAEEITKI